MAVDASGLFLNCCMANAGHMSCLHLSIASATSLTAAAGGQVHHWVGQLCWQLVQVGEPLLAGRGRSGQGER